MAEYSLHEFATASWVPLAFVDALAEAAGVASLALQSDGSILAYNSDFQRLCDVPHFVLERGTLSALTEWMRGQRDEALFAIANLLMHPLARPEVQGEIRSSSGRTLEWRRVMLRDGLSCVWVFADVSEQRLIGAALVDAASWLRMLEVHSDGVLIELDADARIAGLWGNGHTIFGKPDPALQGRRLSDVVPGREGCALDERVQRVLATGGREEYECAVDAHGKTLVLSASAMLMPSADGDAPCVTLMLRDVTERARLQAERMQVERLATVGLLAAGMAHEINNPLAYVLLNLQRLRGWLGKLDGTPSPSELGEFSAMLEMSIEGASRVQAIVRDLKQFSRSDENRLIPVDPCRSLEFALTMAEPQLDTRARLTREIGALPPVRASETRLSQIFLNLIINAAHAVADCDRREIHIVTRTGKKGQAVIEVHDTGHGIAPDALRHIFEPFYTTKTQGMGTGLGLTICHDIVTSLGGSIEVESAEGRGSTFRVQLPSASL
ncbi:MAG TPA: ATP-binding protein [Polyangiaceae bacterium]|nr:ATP-binding protein [Polyangiaceae bacterium]